MLKILIFFAAMLPLAVYGQTKTTQAFHKANEDAFVLFFYSNTLQMLNQDDNPEFDELIKGIDKMKFLRVDNKSASIDKETYKGLVEDYKDEDFEDLMTMRHEGMNINAYIQERSGVTTGIILLMQDNESLSILDIKGEVPISKLTSLISKVKNFNN